MKRVVRDGSGLVSVLSGLAVLTFGVLRLRAADHLSAGLLFLTGLAVLRSGVELLRPTVGE